MIVRRGFRILETPRASSGSVRVRLPLLGENHSSPVGEDRGSPRITLPQHERAPPELTRVAGTQGALQATRLQTWRWASGWRR
jgi:hypothetical protein